MLLSELLQRAGCDARFVADPEIDGVCELQPGQERCLAWCGSPQYLAAARASQAAAILLPAGLADDLPNAVVVAQPQAAFAAVAAQFSRDQRPALGVDSSAVIAPSAQLGDAVRIGAHVLVADGAEIGAGTSIGAGSVIGPGVRIGQDGQIGPRVVIEAASQIGDRTLVLPGAVIGSRGFGNYHDGQRWQAIPQLGRVLIGDDVEIGANTTIDCGALGDTIIGDNVRIDNQCQIAHNVRIGPQTALAAQVGIAGSTTIGAGCMLGGQAGVAGHIEICDRVILNGGAVVLQSITEPGHYGSGTPLLKVMGFRRLMAVLRRLEPRLKALEKSVKS